MRQLVFLIFFIGLFSVWFGSKDSYKKLNGLIITKKSKRWRTVGFIISEIILTLIIVDYWQIELWGKAILMTSVLLIYTHSIYWILFDLSMNLFSDERWYYISDNDQDHNDVNSDKVFHIFNNEFSGIIQFTVKMIFLIGSAALIIILM